MNKFGIEEETYIKILNIIGKYKNINFKIFGSRAKGNYKKNSDIDIAIIGNISEQEEYEIKNEFDMLNIPYMIDLVFLNKIEKKELIKSILNEGVDISE